MYGNQGVAQPFGYTRYQKDGVAGTYFAQAREYNPDTECFNSQDLKKGYLAKTQTFNAYNYCWNSPSKYIDLDGREPEYTEAIYLLSRGTLPGESEYGPIGMGGAFGQGHAAVILVKSDDTGEFYSYAGDASPKILTTGTEGYLSTNVDEQGNPKSISMYDFYMKEGAYADNVNSKNKNLNTIDRYTHGIVIPITNEEGKAMHDKALSIRENPEKYHLFNHNCNQVAQIILRAGGKDFASSKFDWLNTRPKSVYDDIVNEIVNGKREGWSYGILKELSPYKGGNVSLAILLMISNAIVKNNNL